MNYKYTHDTTLRTVSRFPSEPKFRERNIGGKLTGWIVSMDVDITRAGNRLIGSQWEQSTSYCVSQDFFANQYSRDQMISYFYRKHTPKGEEITEEIYLALKKEYDDEAKARL